MVVRITTPASLLETLNYHEHKVRRGVATCIAENHFPYPVHRMNFYHKLEWFQQRNELNTRATTKTIHVSLNYDPSESLTNERLIEIAADYMQRLGFDQQPYLVYRHHDASHPHVHIMATLIRADGSRIPTHNIARDQSEPARTAIEQKYELVHAAGRRSLSENPVPGVKAVYGKSETKRGIANALKQVVGVYNYTTLAELNAVLKDFGVMADRGVKDSFTYRKGGLLYRMLGPDGVPTGVPIKASAIAGKPTLRLLESKFLANKTERELPRLSLQNTLDQIISIRPATIEAFMRLAEKESIKVVLRQNAEGHIYGITFVDHRNRSVFNGSEIGKEYSINGLYKQFEKQLAPTSQHLPEQNFLPEHSITDTLLHTHTSETNTPHHLTKKRKKKKQKL